MADWLRPAYRQLRWWLMRDLGDKAVAGADGWAYYGPNIRYLGERYFQQSEVRENPRTIRPRPSPTSPHQLARRNISLLVVPMPSKPAVAPERLRRGLAPSLDLSVHTRRFHGRAARSGHRGARPLSRPWCASSARTPIGRGCTWPRTRTGPATARASRRRCWPTRVRDVLGADSFGAEAQLPAREP